MRKIMLVIEDVQDLVQMENLLRRLGFDVLSLGKDLLVTDALSRFSPDILIGTYKGRAVDGVKTSARIRKQLPSLRVGLLYSGSAPTLDIEGRLNVDALISVPFDTVEVIQTVAKFAEMDWRVLDERYQKLMTPAPNADELRYIQGDAPIPQEKYFVRSNKSNLTDLEKAERARLPRADRNAKFLKAAKESGEPEASTKKTIPRETMMEAMKALRTASEAEREKLDKINEEKKAFAKMLFEAGAEALKETEKKKR